MGVGISEPRQGATPRAVLPDDLDAMAPGPELAGVLDSVDRDGLNGWELVVLMRARSRLLARVQAEFFADVVAMAYSPPGGPDDPPERLEEPDEFASDEIRAAMSWTRAAAEHNLDVAWRLVERLPAVWAALHAGDIDLPRARVVCDRTDHLAEETAREVAEKVLPRAGDLTTGQLRVRLERLCVDADPDDASERYWRAVDDRRVVAQRAPDGTAGLCGFNMLADRAGAVMEHLTRLAQGLKSRDESRTMDQLRADVFLDLLEGRHHPTSRRRAMVDIRVDLATLVGLDERSGEIPGWGPVIADVARQAVEQQPDGEWRVVVTDPDTGAVLWDGTTRRRPTATQRRWVEARQPTCTFPGCRVPAQKSDFDHALEVAKGGKTLVRALEPACRHDHRLRHEGGWKFQQPTPATYVWTSPRGHTYLTGPNPP